MVRWVDMRFALPLLAMAGCSSSAPPPAAPAPAAPASPAPISSGVLLAVPTGLSVERTADRLSVTVDPKGREVVPVGLDPKLVAGVKHTLRVYPDGTAPGPVGGMGLSGGLDFNLGTRIYHRAQDGVPVPGTRYVVEMELFVFETDLAPEHMWSPESSPRYRVAWSRTLKQIVD